MKERNFKFRASFGKLVDNMTDKQSGEFIKAVSGYVFANKPMESKDEYLKGVFLYVKNILDIDVQNRENGKLGGVISAQKMREKATKREQVVSTSSVVSEVIMVTSGEKGKAAENKNGMTAKPVQRQSCCVTKSSSISKSIAK